MHDPSTWLGDLVAYALFGLVADSGAGAALHCFVMDVPSMFALLVLAICARSLLHTPILAGAGLRGRARPPKGECR
ncbi:hypothetical protein CKO31_10480 [Thiohalocapsa halophila]|uniref:Uncharacterized protein n=1 Tax=Thiohalocapsa halophila TaxID=69359 RepID=A0ABS1CGZ0_9GAMM|nr:hypothetical protein [Thiohalocapsa halophila]MBK1631159.1 hypothetical protein [Thiohalocapsa halophila]